MNSQGCLFLSLFTLLACTNSGGQVGGSPSVFWAKDKMCSGNVLFGGSAMPCQWSSEAAHVNAEVPGATNLFFSRIMQNKIVGKGDCWNNRWNLSLTELVQNPLRFHLVQTEVIPNLSRQSLANCGTARDGLPIQDSLTLTTAYDPSAIAYNGKIWVAFECHGRGFLGSAATCIGNYDPIRRIITPSSIYAAIMGNSHIAGDKFIYSASVPKIFVYKDRVYLYWSAVKMDTKWVGLTTRGVELQMNGGRLLPKGARKWISSNDPSTVEVFGNDKGAEGEADLFQAYVEGDVIYVTGAAGVAGCTAPTNNLKRCYRPIISRSQTPLGHHTYNAQMAPEGDMPPNRHEFSRFLKGPEGSLFWLGMFLTDVGGDTRFPAECQIYPVPKSTAEVLPVTSPVVCE